MTTQIAHWLVVGVAVVALVLIWLVLRRIGLTDETNAAAVRNLDETLVLHRRQTEALECIASALEQHAPRA